MPLFDDVICIKTNSLHRVAVLFRCRKGLLICPSRLMCWWRRQEAWRRILWSVWLISTWVIFLAGRGRSCANWASTERETYWCRIITTWFSRNGSIPSSIGCWKSRTPMYGIRFLPHRVPLEGLGFASTCVANQLIRLSNGAWVTFHNRLNVILRYFDGNEHWFWNGASPRYYCIYICQAIKLLLSSFVMVMFS